MSTPNTGDGNSHHEADEDRGTVETHHLEREVIERRIQILEPDNEGGLRPDGSGGELVEFEELKTIECSCGERFRKEETAVEHLMEEDAYE